MAALCAAAAPAVAQKSPGDTLKANALYRKIIVQKTTGQDFRRHQLFSQPVQKNDAQRGTYQTLLLDVSRHRTLLESNPKTLTLELPKADGSLFEVELVQVNPFAPGAQFKLVDKKGKHDFVPEKNLYFRGIVKGKKTSLAALTVSKDGVQGLFSDETGNFNLGKLGYSHTEYAFYNDRELQLPFQFECNTPDEDVAIEHSTRRSGIDGPPCVMLHVDCDHQLYQLNGSSEIQTANYVGALFNQMAAVYDLEDINLSINEIVVWGDDDEFSPVPDGGGAASSAIALERYADHIQDDYPGEISCLLAADNGGLGGLAWREQLCGIYQPINSSGPYLYCDVDGGAVVNFPTYSWDTYVWTHELGHSLGSRHTHWCGWAGGAIDNCFCQAVAEGNLSLPSNGQCREPTDASCTAGPIPAQGTIMSYCHGVDDVGINLSLGFGIQPGTLIFNNVIDAWMDEECLSACGSECVSTMSIVNNLSSDDEVHFEASESIAGFGQIMPDADIQFDAGELVLLRPGFRAHAGSTFRAYIHGCLDDSARPNNHSGERSSLTEQENTVTTELSGLSVAPNPFSTSTTLTYTLAEHCQVDLQIFNATGMLIANPVQQQQQEAGDYQYTFEANDLPDGIYLVVLQKDGERVAKRVVLTR